jgi:hypothetical protein
VSKILIYVKDWLDAIPEDEQAWIGKLEELKATERRAGWEFAKWLKWGCHQYSRTVEDIAIQVGYSPHTLANILSAMNNSASTMAQELDLTLSHAVAVLGLSEEEKAALLTEAAENSWGADKLRYVARGQRMVNLLSLGGNSIGSAPLNDNATNDETYQTNGEGHTAPVLASQIDPSAGVIVWGMTEPDDVPFTHVPLTIDIPAPVYPMEVATYIIETWGKPFAAKVVEELKLWY